VGQQGRRSRASAQERGHYFRASLPDVPVQRVSELALDATLRAAAVRQSAPGKLKLPLMVTSEDHRRKIREARTGNLILFVVDASGSMAARKRMVAVKGTIMSLLLDAYQKRDRVGLISFRGEEARMLLPPTNSIEMAHRLLNDLPVGGRTPLAHGLEMAERTLESYSQMQDVPLLVLISDGRANMSLPGSRQAPLVEAKQIAASLAKKRVASLIIDAEDGPQRFGLARYLAESLGAPCLRLDEIAADSLTRSVLRFMGR
jgi:magnesium chelatase subunit D